MSLQVREAENLIRRGGSGSLPAVPLYEYACRACAHEFEALVRSDAVPSCPGCGSTDLDRLLSVVSLGRTREAAAPGACSACGDPRGPGSCRVS